MVKPGPYAASRQWFIVLAPPKHRAASAVNSKGVFWFALYEGGLTADSVRGTTETVDASPQETAASGSGWFASHKSKVVKNT